MVLLEYNYNVASETGAGLMVSTLDSWASGPVTSPGCASLHPAGKLNAGGNPAMD